MVLGALLMRLHRSCSSDPVPRAASIARSAGCSSSRRRSTRSGTAATTRRRRWASSWLPWWPPGNSGRYRRCQARADPVLGRSRLPRGDGARHAVGRMAHRADDGHAHHQARPGRRVLRRDERRRRRSSSRPRWAIPVSTTHTITGSIVGTGSVRSFSAVRWGVAGRIVWAWVLTVPGAAPSAQRAYLVRADLER